MYDKTKRRIYGEQNNYETLNNKKGLPSLMTFYQDLETKYNSNFFVFKVMKQLIIRSSN